MYATIIIEMRYVTSDLYNLHLTICDIQDLAIIIILGYFYLVALHNTIQLKSDTLQCVNTWHYGADA